ncbi:hypothetical protein GO755_04640 [Spirosoma sp. HMF4905]|uniref:Phage abortive infection protein n=1 Tax=Spirosoma arboris TaxID=2682092 RepID=A0A7K1S6G9_9BACT|nr:putative phage abortive infection protein [Spirosoma arboris]MVM29310.1 hypothetical protein [Spirosoma arboris]
MNQNLKKVRAYLKKYALEIAILFFSIICCWVIWMYYYQFHKYGLSDNPANWGVFGDYIGGIVGSIFSIISVVLLYYTFKEQRNSTELQKFENKYYELIKLHRDNVDELILSHEKGKKIFVILLREFREALKIVKDINIKHQKTTDREVLIELAYMVLYYGTGPNSTRVLINSLPNHTDNFVRDLAINVSKRKNIVKLNRKFSFTPFEGHQSRLAHYYRHLYQTITFVDSQKFLTEEMKKDYVKTIRAQLSNHEQALLFFNSLSRLGKNWKNEGLILKYSLIKNLPKSFIDEREEIDVKTVFPSLIFEWEE